MNNKSGFHDHSGDKLDENRSGGNGFSLKNPRPFESFKYPAFRIYYGGMAGQWFATTMQTMVRSLLIYRLTGSATMIGIMALAQAIPQLVMCLFGGALADRLQKKVPNHYRPGSYSGCFSCHCCRPIHWLIYPI